MKEKYFAQPSVMTTQQHFAQIPSAEIQRSRFDRSHGYKTTFDAGLLIPVFCDEVLPGDTFTLNATAFARLATPLKPFMDNVFLDMHFFFVPYRQVWTNWERFMGERDDPTDNPDDYSIPQMTFDLDPDDKSPVADYFGLPSGPAGVTNVVSVSALPFRAYRLIYNEWYRDQNLQAKANMNFTNGPDAGYITLHRRNKRHDYFTSCLPWPQKGDPVMIPVGGEAPVFGIGVNVLQSAATVAQDFRQTDGSTFGGTTSTQLWLGNTANAVGIAEGSTNNQPNIYADLSLATSFSVNELRTAFQIQKLLERDARGGTRYIEIVLSHFGVRSDDLRLQRPQYLGGGSTRINVNPVASTVDSTEAPQGNLAAVGTALGNAGFQNSFTEHGVIIGIASVRADLTYQQGIERMFSRQTRYDFYWPALAHLGEQAVLNKEIYAFAAQPDGVFGYQERYAEYRYKPSRITGLFNSDAPASLDVWHLSQDFTATPVLNSSFIQENPPIDRVIAVPDEPHFLADFWFDLKCDRPMPVYSVPGLIDHF